MQKPLVIAYHLVWTAYGWWLPNDPRGSGSRIVHTSALDELGPLHFGRKKTQPAGNEVREFYQRAGEKLQHPLLQLDDRATAPTACGLATCISARHYTCYACAIMPDHVHMVLRKHKDTAEEMIESLQLLSRKRLILEGIRDAEHPVWTLGGWRRFLDRPKVVRSSIAYVENNPLEIGRPEQTWPFVTEYDNWPLHAGHSPNSPYARRLRGCS
ncbi:MAG: hypothetical protein ACR2NM_08725, partial [Bythopirellula sp.]